MSASYRTLSLTIGALLLLLLILWRVSEVSNPCGERRIYLDQAPGLQPGDGIYASERRVGSVMAIERHGRRVIVQMRLECPVPASVKQHTKFYLGRNPEDPTRPCLRALSTGIP